MKKAVILFNLGGPDKLENVEPFLFNLFNDPAILNLPTFFRYPLAKLISNRRAPTAKKIYQELGGSSPILKLTEEQSKALELKLNIDDENSEYKCFIVMRCWHPRAEEVLPIVSSDTSRQRRGPTSLRHLGAHLRHRRGTQFLRQPRQVIRPACSGHLPHVRKCLLSRRHTQQPLDTS